MNSYIRTSLPRTEGSGLPESHLSRARGRLIFILLILHPPCGIPLESALYIAIYLGNNYDSLNLNNS